MHTLLLNADGTPLSYIPMSVVKWQIALKMVFSGKASVLKEHEDWIVRSQHLEIKVPSIIMMTKQVKWNKQVKYSRNNVYLRDDYTCQLQITNRCRSIAGKAKISNLTLDHVVPRAHGGKTNWKNVCTSCKDCNGFKGHNASIRPAKLPYKPSYYEILSKRKTFPIYIRDEEWKFYLDWPDDRIKLLPITSGDHEYRSRHTDSDDTAFDDL